MEIKKVGVVGCGTMGGGIVQVCAQSGYSVVVSEINETFLNKGMTNLNNGLTRMVEKGKLSQENKDAIMGRIKGTTNMNDFADCDLVIEAAIESMDLKKKILGDLDKICPKHALLATNTSCLSILDMAMATSRPDKVLGLHFFNPVPVMALLEIVETLLSSKETIEAGRAFGAKLGKTVVLAKDAPGFIVNRLVFPFILDAIRMYESGVATREDIDNAIRMGLNHPIGPLALADLVGLDVVLFIVDATYNEFKDPKFSSPMILKKMVAAKQLGRKTGKGFYDYGK